MLLAALAISALASAAQAGTYAIDNCPSAPSSNGDPGPWVVFGAPQSSKASCGGGAGDFVGPLGGSMSPGSADGVRVAVPDGSGITIREATIWWRVPRQSSGADTFALAATNYGGVGESHTPEEHAVSPDTFILGSSTTNLMLEDYCSNDDAGQGCGFGAGENPNLELFGSRLTLADSRLPAGHVNGGGLTSTDAVSGTQSIAYEAEDGDSGVRSVSLQIDGAQVAQHDYLAQCPYANFAACPASESDSIEWNTAAVSDGAHSLTLVVASAAQTTRTIYAGTVVIDDAVPPVSPATFAVPGPGVGTGPVNGGVVGHAARLHLNGGQVIGRSYRDRAFRLSGRLVDAQGAPIADGTVDLLERRSVAGAGQLIAQVQTDPRGSFRALVPPGPSRLIDVAYGASSDNPTYGAKVTVREAVRAGVLLSVTPRRTSATGTITLSGRVLGGVPSQGVVVGLFVHYRGRWEPFRTPRTDAHGRFSVVYQFQGAAGRFPFRAEVFGSQSGFPYAQGDSRALTVRTG